jgi:battenin
MTVYLANIVPALFIKASAPYWYDSVSYNTRISASAFLMGLAFLITSLFSASHDDSIKGLTWATAGQLVGVAMISAQCGLGESSLLALSGKCDGTGSCLTAFSAGTGLSGPMGYLWKFLLNEWLGWSLEATLFAAISLAVAYGVIYKRFLAHVETNSTDDDSDEDDKEQLPLPDTSESLADMDQLHVPLPDTPESLANMDATQRFWLVVSLYKYIVPLFVVYFAEYAIQAGAWAALGFPVESEEARDRFYETANWLYQAGVFLSRSSGQLFSLSMTALWVLPGIQLINLVIYTYVAATASDPSVLYHPIVMYALALFTGLLGGAVYVHGYKGIVVDATIAHTEFALASVSVAEGLGVVIADIVGLFLQACLYQANGLQALLSCPI